MVALAGAVLTAKYYRTQANRQRNKADRAEGKIRILNDVQNASRRAQLEALDRHEKAIKMGRDYWANRNKFLHDD